MLKLALTSMRVDQRTRFFREGSILGGTAKSGAVGVETTVEIASGEPAERIAQLVRMAKASCYTHGAVTEAIPVDTRVLLNGTTIEVA
jgi:hypothetical protein